MQINYSKLYTILSNILEKKATSTRFKRRTRFKSPDLFSNDPVDHRHILSTWENKHEKPLKLDDETIAEEQYFCGVDNRNENSLVLKITRGCSAKYDPVCFQLIIHYRGKQMVLTLPDHPNISNNQCKVGDSCWQFRDLKIWCIIPNKTYRIVYNGLLRNEVTNEVNHINLRLRWTALCMPFDFYPYAKAENENFMNRYEHFGMFNGSINVDSQGEEEIHLWGVRSRKLSADVVAHRYKAYAYFKNGTAVSMSLYNSSTFNQHFSAFIMLSKRENVIVVPIPGLEEALASVEDAKIKVLQFTAGRVRYDMYICVENIPTLSLNSSSQNESGTNIYRAQFSLSNLTEKWTYCGKGFFEHRKLSNAFQNDNKICSDEMLAASSQNIDLDSLRDEDSLEVIDYNHPYSSNIQLVGGKGASLASLWKHRSDLNCDVPLASLVTSVAFIHHLYRNPELNAAINEFAVHRCRFKDLKSIDEQSRRIEELFTSSELSTNLLKKIKSSLLDQFGKDFENKLFSVRSSAMEEDGEELSCAGQMTTLLGCKGLTQIVDGIKKCWASCYSFRAVQYRRQYGQLLTTHMCVVIQEMVDANSAGVMFTRDPVTGNPTLISISSNLGLGESVVSGMCEPDTISLKKPFHDEELKILDTSIGKKELMITLKDGGGTSEQAEVQGDVCELSLTHEMVLKLGEVGLLIEKIFGEAKDIEWAVKNNRIYLLQCRPMTALDNETDNEIIHEFDSPVVTDHECFTSGNIKEVLPKSVSPLSLTYILPRVSVGAIRRVIRLFPLVSYNPIKENFGPISHLHVFMNRTDSNFGDNKDLMKWKDLSFNGRVIDDPEIAEEANERLGSVSFSSKMKFLVFLVMTYLNERYYTRRLKEMKMEDIDPDRFKTIHELLQYLKNNMDNYDETFSLHFRMGMVSMFANSQILQLLNSSDQVSDDEESMNLVCSDFALLLNFCSDEESVESADIPRSLEILKQKISLVTEPEAFYNMSAEEALLWITSETCPVKETFAAFMGRHGHRCASEFDVFAKPWEMEPLKLIKALQIMLKPSSSMKNRVPSSVEDAINNLKLHLDSKSRKKLVGMVKYARKAVGFREQAKSLLIRSVHRHRKLFVRLSEMFVDEGLIPDPDLLFFFTFDEIIQFFESRSPRIIQRAIKRRRIFKVAYDLEFPEINIGIPKPICSGGLFTYDKDAVEFKGTPVSHGVITAPVRVCLSIEDAYELQMGEILVAKSTDVAWSPFFPIACGVITELGGLISHGAVVAREYGLPCVIGINNVTSLLTTGEIVTLDGGNGTITKVSASKVEE
ncbi:Uncharacterised protein g10193 [Pycnogonum litorale]